jgi:hypothetical protein
MVLDGQKSALPEQHFYKGWLAEIDSAVERYVQGRSSFNADLVARSIGVFNSEPGEKVAYMRALFSYESQVQDADMKQLLQTIELALCGTNLKDLGQDLRDPYRQAWENIVLEVETADADRHQLTLIRQGTLAVLGTETGKRDEWCDLLLRMHVQAEEQGTPQLALLIQKIVELFDGSDHSFAEEEVLKGMYAQVWQEITLLKRCMDT